MKDDIRFFTALSLENHPILNEKNIYKDKYMEALYYFVSKYSDKDIYAKSLLLTYKNSLNDTYEQEQLKQDSYKKVIKKASRLKLKGFKLFTYRYVFISDCLFICAFDNPELGKRILDEFKLLYNFRYHRAIDDLYNVLYNNKVNNRDFKLAEYQINNWVENKKFINSKLTTILVTATMSAGKSTLINSVVGKKIAETRNEACTSSVNSYHNKAFNDRFIVRKCKSKLGYTTEIKETKSYNSDISVCVFMQSFAGKGRICIIDTPGVNNSLNIEHKKTTENALDNIKYDKLVYVINANNIGVNDDMMHLKNVVNTIKDREIIFVLNKLDTYRLSEDSIEKSIEQLRIDFEKIGYKNAVICPISAYAATLFKKLLDGEILNDDEELDCDMLLRKFTRKEFDLRKYYNENSVTNIDSNISFGKYNSKQIIECLYSTGIINLEQLLMRGEGI